MLLYMVPLVAKPGEKQKVVLRGKGLAAVTEVKVSGANGARVQRLGAKAVAVPNNHPGDRVGDSEVEIELDLPKDLKPGPIKLSATGPGGESNVYLVLVRDGTPATAEKEPNDGFAQAQTLELPAAVEGTIKNERDVDVFRFEGKKGEKIHIEVQAAQFGSPLDALLVLHDANRAVIDSADDTDGGRDPRLRVALPRDGTYWFSVIDAHDLGGPNFGYRLVIRREK